MKKLMDGKTKEQLSEKAKGLKLKKAAFSVTNSTVFGNSSQKQIRSGSGGNSENNLDNNEFRLNYHDFADKKMDTTLNPEEVNNYLEQIENENKNKESKADERLSKSNARKAKLRSMGINMRSGPNTVRDDLDFMQTGNIDFGDKNSPIKKDQLKLKFDEPKKKKRSVENSKLNESGI